MPASRASTICEAAQIKTSASHIVAMPCSCVPSTRMVMLPLRKSIGAVRRDFASEKRSEEHTSELQSLMRISYAVFCLKKKNTQHNEGNRTTTTDTYQSLKIKITNNT